MTDNLLFSRMRQTKRLGIYAGVIWALIAAQPFVLPGHPMTIRSLDGVEEEHAAPARVSGVAVAQHAPSKAGGLSVEAYYKLAAPADEIVPGLRIGPYKNDPPLRATGFGFVEEIWERFYRDNRRDPDNRFYAALRTTDGQTIKRDGTSFSFDSEKLIEFIEREHGDFRAVGFFDTFMVIDYKDRRRKAIIPLPAELIQKIRALDRY